MAYYRAPRLPYQFCSVLSFDIDEYIFQPYKVAMLEMEGIFAWHKRSSNTKEKISSYGNQTSCRMDKGRVENMIVSKMKTQKGLTNQ